MPGRKLDASKDEPPLRPLPCLREVDFRLEFLWGRQDSRAGEAEWVWRGSSDLGEPAYKKHRNINEYVIGSASVFEQVRTLGAQTYFQ